MNIIPVQVESDIFLTYQATPVGRLLEYHNLKKPHDKYSAPEILIGMCMDHRKSLIIPPNFAYIIRTGGGNLRYNEFKVSYAIGVGNVGAIALIAHNNCGMVNLMSRKSDFVNGLVTKAGWDYAQAEEHFLNFAPMFEIDNELTFVVSEAKRLRWRYPKIQVAPLYYKVEDNLLYQIEEG